MSFSQLASDTLDTCKKVFGEEATLHPAGGADVPGVEALFKESHHEIDTESGILVSSSQPVLRLKISDLPSGILLPPESEVTAKGVRWHVVDQHPVGYGDVILILQDRRAA